MIKRARKYFSQHVEFNSLVHGVGGLGVGILIASPFANPHPVRWGLVLLLLSAAGHWYAMTAKK